MILFLRIITVVIAGCIYAIYHFQFPVAENLTEVQKFNLFHKKFLVAHLELLVVVVIELIISFYEESQQSKDNKREIISAFEKSQQNKFAGIQYNIENDSPLRKCAETILSAFERNINSHESGFEIKGSELVLFSYLDFWRFIVDEQTKRNAEHKPPLNVKLAHACDFGILTEHGLSVHLIAKQKEFLQAKGTLLRILISDTKKPEKGCLKAYELMKQEGIPVEYYHKTHARFHDFAFIEDLGMGLEWIPGDSTGAVGSARYTIEIKQLQEDWRIMSSWIDDQKQLT